MGERADPGRIEPGQSAAVATAPRPACEPPPRCRCRGCAHGRRGCAGKRRAACAAADVVDIAAAPLQQATCVGARHAAADIAVGTVEKGKRPVAQLRCPPAPAGAPPLRRRRRWRDSRCSGSNCPKEVADLVAAGHAALPQQLGRGHQHPGVQKPHCSALRSWKAPAGRRSRRSSTRPSMVSTRAAVALRREHRQARAIAPSTRTVQAPQTPCSQPARVPVRPSSSRRKSARFCRAATRRVRPRH